MLGEEGGGGLRHLWAAAESADGHTCCLLLSTSLYTKLRYKVLYTDTRCVTDLHSYTAIQRYTALYSAIQHYTLYSYTALYTIQPLQLHPSGNAPHRRACVELEVNVSSRQA